MSAHDEPTQHPNRTMAGTTLYILTGPIVWAIHLTIIYGAHTLLCVRGVGTVVVLGRVLPVIVIATVTVVALVPLCIALFAPSLAGRRGNASDRIDLTQAFRDGIMRLLTLLSIFGIAWAGATALIVAPCLAMR